MADILNWQLTSGRGLIVEEVLRCIGQGQLVAFPADAGYCVAAHLLIPAAVERLAKLKPADAPLVLALPSPAHALDWVPHMSPLAQRLARRCWPGPVRLVFTEAVEEGLLGQLAEPVRKLICPDGALSLYVPADEAISVALMQLPAPLVLTSVGQPLAATAEEVESAVGKDLGLIVDDGPCRMGKGLSAVRVDGQGWEILCEGAVAAEQLAIKTICVILFVCTGNTCRSPMAEALCRKLLAERLQCTPDELPEPGYLVLSAGLAAMPGEPASPEAVEAVEELGGDLQRHSSQPLNPNLVLQADYLLTMTHSHQAALTHRFGNHGPPIRLLCPEGQDISDPVGSDQEVYRACARQILGHLEHFLPELHIAATGKPA